LLGAVLVVIVVVPLFGGRDAAPPDLSGAGLLRIFSGQILLASFLAMWFALQQRDGWRTFLALPTGAWPPRLRRGLRLGLSGWAITLAAMAILSVASSMVAIEPREGFTDLVVWLATRPLVFRVALVAAAMSVEEAFFRAFLQPRIGLFAATACFAISHLSYGSPAMGGGVFVIGTMLGLAFRRHRDLAVCMVGHGTFDAIQLLVVLPLVATRIQHATA
jgi:membrane protease YdiL (CAAX protease family)